jgi:hypothetical protein
MAILTPVPTVTLWQPWASFVRPEPWCKHVETRSWGTNYRGPLAIHSAKREIDEKGFYLLAEPESEAVDRLLQEEAGDDWLYPTAELWDAERGKPLDWGIDRIYPLGAVLRVAILVDCIQVQEGPPVRILTYEFPGGLAIPPQKPEASFGDYTPGRYAWVLSNITPLSEPIPYPGKQGIWLCSHPAVCAVADRLRGCWEAGKPRQEVLF